MTESEAIKEIESWTPALLAMGSKCTLETQSAQDMAIKALEEVQQYREIGTVEECRTSVEKMKPKNVIKKYKPVEPEDIEAFGKDSYFGYCPECKSLQNTVWNQEYCGDCGQRLDWSGEE